MADPINDIVTINISSQAPGLTQESFNTTMCVCYHTHHISQRVLAYASTADMLTDGWASTEAGYQMAAAQFSNTPAPNLIKIGRRANAPAHTVTFTVTDATAGAQYTLTLGTTTASYTVPSSGSPTTTTVAAAIVTALGTVTGHTIASSGAVITISRAAGAGLVQASGWSKNLYVADATTDPGLAADLAAIDAEDDDWYGLDLDTASKAEITALAAWTETSGKLFTPRTFDSAAKDSTSSTDVMSTLKTSAYTRTGAIFSGTGCNAFTGSAWQGNCFPDDPGTENWAFKTLPGIQADALTTTERNTIETKNGSCYTARRGQNITQFGATASGSWLDFQRGLDWLKEDMQTNVYQALLANKKIPYTDRGIAVIKQAVDSALQDAVTRGFIQGGYTITVPTAASISPAVKATRKLSGFSWSAVSAGAVNGVTINGTVS